MALPTQGCDQVIADQRMECELASAESELGFDIRRLPSIPPGLEFGAVLTGSDPRLARQTYTRPGAELTITQVLAVSFDSFSGSDWSNVPSDAVELVRVNDHAAEYVRGMFVSRDWVGTLAVWGPEAPVQRLRWQDGGFVYELQLAGLTGPLEDVGVEWLIALAESLE